MLRLVGLQKGVAMPTQRPADDSMASETERFGLLQTHIKLLAAFMCWRSALRGLSALQPVIQRLIGPTGNIEGGVTNIF